MKTKKFFMTSLLVMGMIIARAANGFPPELVLVSQPVLTYNANSVTLYYDVQNIGDYTYKGYVYIYLDPDDGYCYAKEWVRVCPGGIKRIAISIPAFRPNPSWTYTVMPYYELYDELFSFTTFEYFEPLRFCWYGYHNEPWVVIKVGPRPRYYNRPGTYRYYYDGFRPPMPPPGGGPGHPHDMPPMDPKHHTYGYHHSNGGYPANHHPEPGHNPAPNSGGNSGASVNPHGSNTAGSIGASPSGNNPNNGGSSGAMTRPSSSGNNSSGSSGATTRPSSSGNSGSSGSSGTVTRPSSSGNSGSSGSSGTVTRPSSSGNSGSSGRTGNSSSSRGRSGSSSSSSSSSGRSGSGSTGRSR